MTFLQTDIRGRVVVRRLLKLEKDAWLAEKADQRYASITRGYLAAMHSGIALLSGRANRSQKQGFRNAGKNEALARYCQDDHDIVQQHFSQ